jgi:hypothetical protein
MAAPVNVVVVFAKSTGAVNAASDDFCHFVTFPVFPVRVKFAGVVPVQMVWLADIVPPSAVAATVISWDSPAVLTLQGAASTILTQYVVVVVGLIYIEETDCPAITAEPIVDPVPH